MRYCSILASKDVFKGNSFGCETVARLSADLDHVFLDMERKSPSPVESVLESISALAKDKSRTDLQMLIYKKPC